MFTKEFIINNLLYNQITTTIHPFPTFFKILYSNWIFIIPILLLIYSIVAWLYGSSNQKKNIKRIYYSFAILGYLIFIRSEDVSVWCKEGPLGITAPVWSHLFSLLIFFIIIVAIDCFIISGYVFLEFGIFGAKFIKESVQETVVEQKGYILSLERNLETVYDIPLKIYEVFSQESVRDQVDEGIFNFTFEFRKILKYYYDLKLEHVTIDVESYICNIDTVNDYIKYYSEKFNLNFRDTRKLRACLNDKNGTNLYLEKKYDSLYLITWKSGYLKDKMILITIKSKDEINILDAFPICNFLYCFELEISTI